MSLLLLAQVAAPVVPAASAAAPPAVGSAAWQATTLRDFTTLNFTQLDGDKWFFVASHYGTRALFVLVLMTLAWTLSSWAASLVRVALERVKFDETLTLFFAKLVRYLILLLVSLSCLGYFGVQTTGFAAILGAAGLAIGLAFQGTLSNFAAGAMLLIFRPYKVGDSVVLAGYTGTVYEIELFTTALDLVDNRRVIIPNSSIFGAVIENHSSNSLRRVEVLAGVAYSADIDATRSALERAAESVSLLSTTKKIEIVLLNLGASSVDWAVRGWAKREVLGDAKQALLRAVKMELDRSNIGIPFPQLDIHFDPQDSVAQRRAA